MRVVLSYPCAGAPLSTPCNALMSWVKRPRCYPRFGRVGFLQKVSLVASGASPADVAPVAPWRRVVAPSTCSQRCCAVGCSRSLGRLQLRDTALCAAPHPLPRWAGPSSCRRGAHGWSLVQLGAGTPAVSSSEAFPLRDAQPDAFPFGLLGFGLLAVLAGEGSLAQFVLQQGFGCAPEMGSRGCTTFSWVHEVSQGWEDWLSDKRLGVGCSIVAPAVSRGWWEPFRGSQGW